MQFLSFRPLKPIGLLATFASVIFVAACGSSEKLTTPVDAPVISVTGVVDSATYSGPVTISIDIDKGSYSATLDNVAFISGGTVQAIGPHILVVTAQAGTEQSTKTVHFTIQGPTGVGGALIIRMFDLGTKENTLAPGDAILITDSSSVGNQHVLIDAGPAGPLATDYSYVSRQLTAVGADTLAVMLLTHAHSDHYGGMLEVFKSHQVKRFMYSGQIRSTVGYTDVLSKAQTSADSVIVLKDSIRSYSIGYGATKTVLQFLRPLQTYLNTDTDDGTELNEGSVGTRLDLGTFSMFFTGDSEKDATKRWRTSYPSLTANIKVLKVGHHGANNAIFDDGSGSSNKSSIWLDWTRPATSIISANGTTHPRIFALARLYQSPGNTVFCTNVHGMITITVLRDGTYTVKTEKKQSAVCEAGSEATT